jgi:hypothetical protein
MAAHPAEVAEPVDATVSNTVEGNLIRVQIPASAPTFALSRRSGLIALPTNLSHRLAYPSAMATRTNQQRLYESHRAGLFQRLTNSGRMSSDNAEHWLTAWEAEAAQRGTDWRSDLFWRPAWDWIASNTSGGSRQDRT